MTVQECDEILREIDKEKEKLIKEHDAFIFNDISYKIACCDMIEAIGVIINMRRNNV